MRQALMATTAMVGLLLVAGCSGGPTESGESVSGEEGEAPSIEVAPTVMDFDDVTLPLDSYTLLAEQLADLDYASRLLASDCMRRFGIDWEPGGRNDFSALDDRTNRLGLVEEEQAASFGYHLDPARAGDFENQDAVDPLSEEEARIFDGGAPDAPARGDVPAGGCLGEAQRRLEWDTQTFIWLQMLSNEATGAAFADERALALNERWSACMADAGFDYDDPVDAAEEAGWDYERPASQEEISTAVADVRCKREVNFVGEMTAILTAHQREIVEENFERLEAVKEETEAALANAARVLSGQPIE